MCPWKSVVALSLLLTVVSGGSSSANTRDKVIDDSVVMAALRCEPTPITCPNVTLILPHLVQGERVWTATTSKRRWFSRPGGHQGFAISGLDYRAIKKSSNKTPVLALFFEKVSKGTFNVTSQAQTMTASGEVEVLSCMPADFNLRRVKGRWCCEHGDSCYSGSRRTKGSEGKNPDPKNRAVEHVEEH